MQVNPNTNEWQREAQLDRLGHSLAHSLSTHVAPDTWTPATGAPSGSGPA